MPAERHADMMAKIARHRQRLDREIARQKAELDASNNLLGLNELAAKYEEKWPEIRYTKGGSRARKAVDLVLRGAVHKSGMDARGDDLWTVAGHECSKAGGWCTCEDRVFVDPKYGKLCYHRLAVALKTHWLGDQNPALLDLLTRHVIGHGHADLLVEREYEWHGNGQRAAIAGYTLPGMKAVKLPHEDRVETTLPQFQWAMGQIGWGLADLPTKLPGWSDYLYRIQPEPGIPINELTFYYRGRTWLMEERERTRRGIVFEIARNLPQHLAGPMPIRLNAYDARRVYQLRQQLEAGERQAEDVWSALPEELQLAIIENEGVKHAYQKPTEADGRFSVFGEAA